MKVELKVVGGSRSGQSIPINIPQFMIGRAEDCHLKPRSELISRYHCTILSEDSYVAVRDLGSKNGVYVNGERIVGEQELKNGDHLAIGPLEFEVALSVDLKGNTKPKVTSIADVVTRTLEQSSINAANEKQTQSAHPEPETVVAEQPAQPEPEPVVAEQPAQPEPEPVAAGQPAQPGQQPGQAGQQPPQYWQQPPQYWQQPPQYWQQAGQQPGQAGQQPVQPEPKPVQPEPEPVQPEPKPEPEPKPVLPEPEPVQPAPEPEPEPKPAKPALTPAQQESIADSAFTISPINSGIPSSGDGEGEDDLLADWLLDDGDEVPSQAQTISMAAVSDLDLDLPYTPKQEEQPAQETKKAKSNEESSSDAAAALLRNFFKGGH